MKHADAAASAPKRRTGRPLSVDRDTALQQAMLAFWRHGYETPSIADLTDAMGITAPSLYTAFGDKKRLFLEAAQRYAGDPAAMTERISTAPTAYQAVREMLTASAIAVTGPDTPRGRLPASATASGSKDSADVQCAIGDIRRTIAGHLRARIEQDVAALAGQVVAVIQGLSVLARDGMPREGLLTIADTALGTWPAVGQP